MKNTIEIKNNIVRKTYASRIDYLREEKLYKQLAGSGLAPEYIDSGDGFLEHEYVVGDSYIELLAKAEGDIKQLSLYFRKFYDWYAKYRELTHMNLGQVRFEKFILTGDRLVNLEFENCKSGYLEEDIAKLAAQMCMVPEPFSDAGIEMARFFVCVGFKTLQWNSLRLNQLLSKALKDECLVRGAEYNTKRAEYISTVLCCTGIVFAGGQTLLESITDQMKSFPQKFISLPRGRAGYEILIPGFINVQSNANINNSLARLVASQKDANQVWTFCVTTDMPVIPKLLLDTMLECDKENCCAVIIEAGGKLREFPVLLNNALTKIELSSVVNEKESSFLDVLAKMPVKIIRLEDIR